MHQESAGLQHLLREIERVRESSSDEAFRGLVDDVLEGPALDARSLLGPDHALCESESNAKLGDTLVEYGQLKRMLAGLGFDWTRRSQVGMLGAATAVAGDSYFAIVTLLLAAEILARHEGRPVSRYVSPAQLGMELDADRLAEHAAPQGSIRIFLASTYESLKSYRAAAEQRITSLGHRAETAESFRGQEAAMVADNIRALLRTCHACLLMLGRSRGAGPLDQSDPQRGSPSFTQIEFREAKATNTPVFCYVVDDTESSPISAQADAEFMANFRSEIDGDAVRVRPVPSVESFVFSLGLDISEIETNALPVPTAAADSSDDPDSLETIFGAAIAPTLRAELSGLPTAAGRPAQELSSLCSGYPNHEPPSTVREADALNDEGWGYHGLGRYRDALAKYDAALAACRNFPLIWNNRGLAYYRLEQPDLAEACYLEAVRIAPGFIKPWSNMAILQWELRGDRKAAERWLDRALAIDPTYARALRLRDVIRRSGQ